jgi:hypothetical protein
MTVRYNKNTPLIKIGLPIIGQSYHVSWGYCRGIVGRCISIDHENKTVILETPKTKKKFKHPVPFSQLLHTRKNQHNPELTPKP